MADEWGGRGRTRQGGLTSNDRCRGGREETGEGDEGECAAHIEFELGECEECE